MLRNLLYSCCALTHSEEWRLNVERLCKYRDAFNGRRIILVKTGPGIADPESVRAAFAGLGPCEFVEMPNDPALWDAGGFTDGLSMLESTDANEITFFAHTKGASYVDKPATSLRGVRRWRNRMYDELLSDTKRVEEAFRQYWCVGCFRISGYMPNLATNSNWHFAGTFWWVRHDKLFTHKAWRALDNAPVSARWAVESYLGGLFPVERGFCIHGENPGALYDTSITHICPCGHSFLADTGVHKNPVKVCPKCFRRKAVPAEDEIAL